MFNGINVQIYMHVIFVTLLCYFIKIVCVTFV